ncbi:MAG: hypothetical protein KF865_02705 [Bdellovibrionaceae bacterium]|nr:hypothetical protein [Pseudobdellovibrionaceae bacterium]
MKSPLTIPGLLSMLWTNVVVQSAKAARRPLATFFLLAVTMAVNPAEAKILRGDWHSSGGAPVPPYDPTTPVEYECHAEVTDHMLRSSTMGSYKLYAVAKFNLTNSKRIVRAENLSWTWLRRLEAEDSDNNERVLARKPREAFSLEGNWVSIYFHRGETTEQDQVALSAHTRLPLGNGYALDKIKSDNPLLISDTSSMSVRATAFVSKPQPRQDSDFLQRDLFVECERRR